MTIALTRSNLAEHAASLKADGCFEHGVEEGAVCEQCADCDRTKSEHAEALGLYKQADTIETMQLALESDRVHLREFANSLRDKASGIMGRLQRQADREARRLEDAAQ